MARRRFEAALAACAAALGFVLWGCGDESCLRSRGGGCEVVTPCEGLQFECEDRGVSVRRLERRDDRPGGTAALGSPGDILLSNSVVEAVIEALDHPHDIGPTGGNLLDLATAGDDNDSLNHLVQAVGFLPGDATYYEELELIEGEGFAAVQVHGRLDGFPDVRVHTRYEIRPCEPGVRVRTEMVNWSSDPQVWALLDGWYWSGKETLPFAPGRGTGFDQPGVVDPITDSFIEFPYMAAASHSEPSAAYSCTPCNELQLTGFQTEQLSGAGLAPRVVQPRDYAVFERFIAVADGRSVSGAIDAALEVRSQLHGERWATIFGTLDGNLLGNEARATVHISEGTTATPIEDRIPRTQVTPGADGRFRAMVPADRSYVVELEAFGRRSTSWDVEVGDGDMDMGTLEIADAAELELAVTVDGVADHSQVFVHPADEVTAAEAAGRLLGGFVECAPLIGAPHGPSPACNRVLLHDGPVRIALPPGRWDLFATAGPFATVARAMVDLERGEQESVALAVERLPVQPAGTLSGDFHVHGAASFDSSIPDYDRVRAFLASGIDVIASTDHDVSNDYAEAMEMLGARDRMALMVGVETTGHILFGLVPGADLPKVIGHWNFWPFEYDPDGPWRGSVWDELVEPGMLMTRMEDEAGWSHETGVVQMNHPWDETQFGRDLGFVRGIGLNALEPLPLEYDGTGQGLLMRTPEGSRFANGDYHTQEVMNGTANHLYLAYRAFWFYMLNQGQLRVGTANSDSHGLADSVVGTPRNLVWTRTTVEDFDEVAFNADLRAGHAMGTNGPVIEVSTIDASGEERRPSLSPFVPAADPSLSVRVSAAPWVPVEEVRVIVNGEVAQILPVVPALPEDPFGAEGIVRFEDEIPLEGLLPEDGSDAWVVVEAGHPLEATADLDCDGIPDTGDNNEDGEIDWRDVDRNGDDVVDDDDVRGVSAPPRCDETVGPLREPPPPERDDRGYPFWAVTPGARPVAFTNPLVLDRSGDGFDAPGRLR